MQLITTRKIKMTRKHLIFITFILIALTLTLTLSGCSGENADLEGKNIVTFELGGGTLEFKTSSVNTKINFAYYPGTYIIDPAEIPGYNLYRNDYIFTGWYTSPECAPTDKWNFETTTFDQETLTLYAGWEKAIVYRYVLYYLSDGTPVELGSYTVKAGDVFEDWRDYASDRANHTPYGYYSDPELTTPWDFTTAHPGGEADLDIPVYVKHIEGKWALVGNYDELMNAVSSTENVYLTSDIDCGGNELYFSVSYSAVFEGNGHTVSNFTVSKTGGVRIPACAIFKELSTGAVIRNVNFTGASYTFNDIASNVHKIKVAALAVAATGTTVSNVTVTGSFTTNYNNSNPEIPLPDVNSAFFEETDCTITDFSSTLTLTVESD